MDAVSDGRVTFFPSRYAKTYLDWLGEKRDNQEMLADGWRLRQAVDFVVSEGFALTRDIGGKASTTQAAHAVSEMLNGDGA